MCGSSNWQCLSDCLPDRPLKMPCPQEWIPDAVWRNVAALALLGSMSELPESMSRAAAAWNAWYNSEAPEKLPLPDGFDVRLSPFEQLCVIRQEARPHVRPAAVPYGAFHNPCKRDRGRTACAHDAVWRTGIGLC